MTHVSTYPILLATLNAKYIHASLGLRYLFANMGDLQEATLIKEFTIHKRIEEIAEELLMHQPKIIGLGVYIWNIEECAKLVAIIKGIAPQVVVIIGGPEVSYEAQEQVICQYADYVISGQADLEFPKLCQAITTNKSPLQKYIKAATFKLGELKLPYQYYTDEDIRHRLMYVEASRGCPYKCEFCLSALDKTAYPFDLDIFLSELENLYQRGVRHFKFVDRTFNLKIKTSLKILDFFLQKKDNNLFLHFELIPDHLPDKLKEAIQQFPAGSLQFEIGIQSFNNDVQTHISRNQDNNSAIDNLKWLREFSHAHLHTDLIAGLPGEDIESFATGFDRLIELRPHEIQVGILKRLKGTPIIRHTNTFNMTYNPAPPYNLLSNRDLSFSDMQRITRFARYWDMIGNSGRFARTLPLILGRSPFQRFMNLCQWLYEKTGQTHQIELRRLFTILHEALISELFELNEPLVTQTLLEDFNAGGYTKGVPKFLQNLLSPDTKQNTINDSSRLAYRQARHQKLP